MGTPDFAAASLRHLLTWGGCDIVGVYAQPDRPCGRGQICTPPPVKVLAMEKRLPVFQPLNFKAQPEVDQLAALKPDLLLVAAYGLILPQSVLDIPPLGALNVHASLLPEYRGAAPIHRAIMDGRHVTGITIMRMEAGLDTGDILLQRSLAIGIEDTAQTLHDELAEMGGRLLVDALELVAQTLLLFDGQSLFRNRVLLVAVAALNPFQKMLYLIFQYLDFIVDFVFLLDLDVQARPGFVIF